ncbi:Acyl-CoA dehydrogenase, short-chain specific [bioreactor metagenome]|uniref:Acyl-CoA dehydrogenase, short-chain specific n=1 Tax=bioreactor metagenome TaxID=1076179 RepID=A0A645GWV2_9ZZZZ
MLAALQLAAEQVGGAAQCLQLAVDYTKERVQFGKPVASFQAVKHRVAEMMVCMETARSTVRGVAARVAQGVQGNGLDEAALAAEVAAARVQATEAYRYCAQEAIQLHGGVGFTWEYDPQLHFKRAHWASQWFGPTRDWREALAAHLLDAA